jgi:ribonuclease P protein component
VASGPWRIRDRSTFDLLRRTGTRSRCGSVTVVYAADQGERARVAFGVGRRTGSAVTRNRIRRVLRDELSRSELPSGAYLVNVSPTAASRPTIELRSDLRVALERLEDR